jgi:formylmethanofuran dehydrogenase subunit E
MEKAIGFRLHVSPLHGIGIDAYQTQVDTLGCVQSSDKRLNGE